MRRYLVPNANKAAKIETEDHTDLALQPGEVLVYKDKNATYLHAMGQASGTVFVTNFRVVFEPEHKVRARR